MSSQYSWMKCGLGASPPRMATNRSSTRRRLSADVTMNTRRMVSGEESASAIVSRRRRVDEPFFDPSATERRRDDEHPANGVRGRERVGNRLTSCSGVAPDDALNLCFQMIISVCRRPARKLGLNRLSCETYSPEILDRLAYDNMQR